MSETLLILLPPWRGRRGGRSVARGAGGGLSGSWGPHATSTRTEQPGQTQTTQALGQHGQLRCLQPFLGEWRLQRCWLPCTQVHKAADGLESRLEPRVASCDRRGEGCPRRSSAFQESRRDAADPDESSQSETCPGRLRRGRSCGEPELGPWPQSSSQTGPVQGSIPRMVRQRILEGAR